MSNIYGDYWRNRKDQIDKDKEDALALLNSNKQNQIASNLGAYEQASLYYDNNAKRMAQMGLTGGGYGDYLKGNVYTDYLKGVHGINKAAMEQQQNIYGAYNDAKLAYDADFMKAKEGVYSNLFNMARSGAYNTFNPTQFNEQLGIYGSMLNYTQKVGLQQIQAEQQNIYAQKKNIENFNIALNYANSGTYDAYTTDGQFNTLKTQYGLNDDQINTIKRTISDKRFNKYLTNVASGFYDQIERSKVEEELKASGLTKEQINNILGYYDTKKANASASVQTGGTDTTIDLTNNTGTNTGTAGAGTQQPNAGGGKQPKNEKTIVDWNPKEFYAPANSNKETAKSMLENYKKSTDYNETTYKKLEKYYNETFNPQPKPQSNPQPKPSNTSNWSKWTGGKKENYNPTQASKKHVLWFNKKGMNQRHLEAHNSRFSNGKDWYYAMEKDSRLLLDLFDYSPREITITIGEENKAENTWYNLSIFEVDLPEDIKALSNAKIGQIALSNQEDRGLYIKTTKGWRLLVDGASSSTGHNIAALKQKQDIFKL